MEPAILNKQFEKTLDFFQAQLREPNGCALSHEYPLVFDPERLQIYDLEEAVRIDQFQNSYALLKQEEEIQAGLVCLPRKIKIKTDFEAHMLFVGSVVTAPEYRKTGLQKKLFSRLIEKASEAEFDAIVLWSNQLDFYKKLGFFLGGLQATWFSSLQAKIHSGPGRVPLGLAHEVEVSPKWFESFSQKDFRVQRSFEDFKKLLQIPQMKIAYTDSAYALLGKGEDFKGVCHEWAGPADEVLCCLAKLQEEEKDLKIISPGIVHTREEQAVLTELEKSGYESRLEYLGLFRLLSGRLIEERLKPESLAYPFFIWGLDSI